MLTARKFWHYALLFIAFSVPNILIYQLGPAMVTIVQATGPILVNPK